MKILAQHAQSEKIAYIECDRCGRKDHDIIEVQEYLSWKNVVGYGGVPYLDGDTIEIDLCQYCVKEVLGEWIRTNYKYV